MKVLVLGASPIADWLREIGEDVRSTTEQITPQAASGFDLLVSHGYRHVLSQGVLLAVNDNAVNCHISMLPWNRGSDPNFWSWFDDTPKGVTIHYMDRGLDTGDIIAQRAVGMTDNETFATSYQKLQTAMLDLFRLEWTGIRYSICRREPQRGKGSYHRAEDLEPFRYLIPAGWDTPVSAVREVATEVAVNRGFNWN